MIFHETHFRRPALTAALVALGMLVLLQIASRAWPELPHTPSALMLVVIVAAYIGGVGAALLAAALVVGYAVLFWSLPGQSLSYAYDDGVRILILSVAGPVAALLVGYLKYKSDTRFGELKEDIARRIEVEAVLKQAEARNAALVKSMDRVLEFSLDVICTTDADGRFAMVSAASERIWGYRPDEMIGRHFLDFVHPEDHVRSGEVETQVVAGHSVLAFENRLVRKDGKVAHMMWSAQWSEQDQLMFSIARDVTEQRQLEEERARAQQFIKTLKGLLAVCGWCNKIRNEDGNWEKLERYIEHRSEAQFSHSLCPECLEKRYPSEVEEAG